MPLPGNEGGANAARLLRLAGIAEIALGLVLLIAGFAAASTILAVVGAVLVASSGTIFVLARRIG